MPTGIYNHKPRTEETKNKIRLAHIGMKNSPEARKKISLALTGKKQSAETIEKRRIKLVGNKSRTGDHRSKEEIEKMNRTFKIRGSRKTAPKGFHPKSEFQKGCKSWLSGLNKENDERVMKISVRSKKTAKALWQKPEYVRKQMKARGVKPNKIEKELEAEILIFGFKYVGDGALIVGGKCPDYWNGKNKLIELYGDYWHKNQEPQDKIDFYEKLGYQCIIIWEKDFRKKREDTLKLVWEFSNA